MDSLQTNNLRCTEKIRADWFRIWKNTFWNIEYKKIWRNTNTKLYKQNTIKNYKGCILFFRKDYFGVTKNYRATILSSIAAKVYSAQFLIQPDVAIIFSTSEKSEQLPEKSIRNCTDSDFPSNHRRNKFGNFELTLLC